MNAHPQQEQFALSPLHAAVARVQRVLDASIVNEIVNHPAVLPQVSGTGKPLDLTAVVQNTANIVLHDDGAAAIFSCLAPGIFEVHSMALPDRRGAHVARCSAAFLHLMFTRTQAVEILTRLPKGNAPAAALARMHGFRYEFTTPNGWATPAGPEDVAWHRLDLKDWASRARGLVERGHWFHEAVDVACADAGITRKPHPEDETHNRYAGLACEMILGGMLSKGVHFLNRFAAITSAPLVVVISTDPLVIHIGDIALGVDLRNQTVHIVKAQ